MIGIDSTKRLQDLLTARRAEQLKQDERNKMLFHAASAIVDVAEHKRDQAHRASVMIVEDTFKNLGPNLILAKQENVYNDFVSEIRDSLIELLNQQYAVNNVVEMYTSWALDMSDVRLKLNSGIIDEKSITRTIQEEKQHWIYALEQKHNFARKALAEEKTHNAVREIYLFATQEITAEQLERNIASKSALDAYDNLFRKWEWSTYTYEKTNPARMAEELNATIASAQKVNPPAP